MKSSWTIALIATAVFLAACGTTGPRRYALQDPVWVDHDCQHVPTKPNKIEASSDANSLDKPILRPLSHFFTFPLESMAKNVNAMDEVPNSSWFTNRIGLHAMSPKEVAQGSCGEQVLDPSRGPWFVAAAKPDGATPGFFVKTPTGNYLLKFDGPVQPQRATGADVIGSKIYHAAGYNVPCNQIVYFSTDILKIGQGAMAKNEYGEKYPVTQKEVAQVLRMGSRLKDGRVRAVASKFLPGEPWGNWDYESTRSDDPNDVIPHEDRRELRAAFLLAAWLNHWDDREGNTLDLWVSENGRSYLRHYYIDFGDCLGYRSRNCLWTRRSGFSHDIDWEHILVDLITLGLVDRPWRHTCMSNQAEIFGYFRADDFVASEYRGKRPNIAFSRMTHADALWMVRIISRFTDDHIRAIVKQARFLSAKSEEFLIETLAARRDKILAEYLTQYAPLDRFRLVRRSSKNNSQSLCFEDLAIRHKLVAAQDTLYKLRFYVGQELDQLTGFLQFQPDPDHTHRSCVVLPIGDTRPADLVEPKAADDHPLRYGLLKIYIHQKPILPPDSSIWLHFYDLGPTQGFRLVGIERPEEPVVPENY